MDALLSAIVQDDLPLVGRLLKQEPSLAKRLVETPKLYDSVIYHWLYVGDSTWLPRGIGSKLPSCSLPRAQALMRPRIIAGVRRCTTRRMAISTALLGMRNAR